ncbi:DUF1579 family protein [Microvirga puerhi]|uniref:DUF1579 domain-containing protein n=1 Tax=Microvirga puerhi TaxID=2876078 RepID=A0ABS7VJX7_9HYPH|nr:DUF1579 family protein [Microvirga puerhi]MBZ6075830.1 DUF1579 domain-containing protein [Microvirga puerhi]
MASQPRAEHLRLQALAGLWIGEEVLSDTPWMKGGRATGHVDARVTLGGFVLEQDYRQERDGRETFQAKGLFTFDSDLSEYRLFWFDDLGFPPAEPAGGTWEGDTLTVLRRSPRAIARHTFAIRNAQEYELAIENSWDGGASWAPVMTGHYRRRPEDHPSSVA